MDNIHLVHYLTENPEDVDSLESEEDKKKFILAFRDLTKVLNQETNQFEQIDDSNYRNSNPNYGQCCSYMNYGNFGN